MTAEWIQVVLAGIALYLAWNYLKQHDEKVRIEFRLQLIKDTLGAVIKFQDAYLKIFKVGTEFRNSNKFFLTIAVELVKEYEYRMSYFSDVDSKFFEIDLNMKLINSIHLSQAHQVYKNAFLSYKGMFETLKKGEIKGEELKIYIKKFPSSANASEGEIPRQMAEAYTVLMNALLFEFNKKPK